MGRASLPSGRDQERMPGRRRQQLAPSTMSSPWIPAGMLQQGKGRIWRGGEGCRVIYPALPTLSLPIAALCPLSHRAEPPRCPSRSSLSPRCGGGCATLDFPPRSPRFLFSSSRGGREGGEGKARQQQLGFNGFLEEKPRVRASIPAGTWRAVSHPGMRHRGGRECGGERGEWEQGEGQTKGMSSV